MKISWFFYHRRKNPNASESKTWIQQVYLYFHSYRSNFIQLCSYKIFFSIWSDTKKYNSCVKTTLFTIKNNRQLICLDQSIDATPTKTFSRTLKNHKYSCKTFFLAVYVRNKQCTSNFMNPFSYS